MGSASDTGWVVELFPNALSVCLMLLSTRLHTTLENRVEEHRFVEEHRSDDREVGDFAVKVARYWITFVGFHSAMPAAILSALLAALDDPVRTWLVVLGVMVPVLVWFAVGVWLSGVGLMWMHEGDFPPASKLDALVVLLNVGIVLMIALGIDERRAQVLNLAERLWPF